VASTLLTVSSRWPFPGDSPTDRARQVAIQYRTALEQAAPAACHAIDQAALWVGETWVLPGYAVETEDDLVTVARAAELVGMSRRWVYLKVTRAAADPVRVRLADARAAVAHERGRRAVRVG
jgi:hypothetical protein